jgi:signal peptidase
MKLKKLFKFFYYTLVVFIGTLAFLLILSTFPIVDFRVKNVLSGSMEPAINIGSIVAIRKADEYRVGDIITFQFPREFPITHRIVDIEADNGILWFTTKGDANEEPDPRRVRQEEIMGRVLFSIPFIGYAINFTQQPLGFILIIVIPGTIIIYEEFRKIGKEIAILRLKSEKKGEEQDKQTWVKEAIDEKRDKDIQKLREEIRRLKK